MENIVLIGLNELGVGSHIVYEKRPCKILSKVNIKNGKHGCAKSIMDIKDIFNGNKHKLTLASNEKVESPIVTKEEYRVINIEEDYLEVTDKDGNQLEPMNLPQDIELRDKIVSIFEEESQVIVLVMRAMDESQIISCNKDKN